MNKKTTKIIKIDTNFIDEQLIEAVELIRRGDIVAFPTETVYGLGVDALNEEAIKKVFVAKNRPSDNPLIAHISDKKMLEKLTNEVNDTAQKLMDAFWPGALTIIFKKKDGINNCLTAGLDTVAVRMPDNKIALRLIELSNTPLAAPSANLSGKPSPVTAEHVYNDMNGKIEIILDGGTCIHGVESSVVMITDTGVRILRPGSVTKEMIEDIGIAVEIDEAVMNITDKKVISPGMKYKHYSPNAQVIVLSGDKKNIKEYIKNTDKNKDTVVLTYSDTINDYDDQEVFCLGDRKSLDTVAKNIYIALRKYNDYDIIFFEGVSYEKEGLAIMNRMIRAAGFNIIEV